MMQTHFCKRTSRVVLTLVAALSLSLLSACARKPQAEQAVDAAARRYSSIRSGMTRQEVITALGEPTKREETVWRWEVSANAQSNASLDVQFDGKGRVARIAKSHATRD